MGELASAALYFVLNHMSAMAATIYFPPFPVCILLFGEPEFEEED